MRSQPSSSALERITSPAGRLLAFSRIVSDAMPFILSERAICSPLGPATVAPSTVQMVMRSAMRSSGIASAMLRACSVLQFQAKNIGAERAGRGRRRDQDRPTALEQGGFQGDHRRALPLIARPRQHDGIEHAAIAADKIVAAWRVLEPGPR